MTAAAAPGLRPLAPERVFALVVGIESYRAGSAWNLRGPARDALRMAAWLTGPAGVPAANVRLFLSPLEPLEQFERPTPLAPQAPFGPPEPCDRPEPARPPAGAPLPGARLPGHRPAVSTEIEDALLHDLPACDGDLLWIYWAGHGWAGDDDRLLLPFADTAEQPIRHLDLGSALRFWRSTSVAKDRFPRVVSIGDACRLDLAPNARTRFGSVDYGRGSRVPGRRDFVLYASRPGMPAQNVDGAGRLTDTLLARLDGRSLDESVRRLPEIAAQVRDDLAALAAEGRAWQRIQWQISDWDGNPLAATGWDAPGPAALAGVPALAGAPAVTGAPRLDQTAWDELHRLFAGPRLPRHAYRAYRWAFEVAGCAPPGPALPARDPMAVLRDLDDRLGTVGRLPLPLLYVRFLAAREPDPDRAAALADWVRRTAGRIAADALPAPEAPEGDGRGALHVRLTESSGSGAHLVRIWLHRDGFEQLWESAGPIGRAELREALTRQLLGDAARLCVDRIEFHVPEALLDEDFDRWRLPIGRRGRPTELGRRFEVVVRCPDERTGLAETSWLRKWAWFRAYGGRDPAGVLALGGAVPDDSRVDRLAAEDHPVCALADVPRDDLPATLAALLDAGLPIAVWRREGDDDPLDLTDPDAHADAHPDPDDRPRPDDRPDPDARPGAGRARAPGAVPPAGPDLDRLPATVRRLRTGGPGAPPRPLVLLWDDPEHRPQTRSLS
ncbi:VMAP-C domain-containing protein [Kitasatospora sp. NPDC054939]